jgi:hypothetical protein
MAGESKLVAILCGLLAALSAAVPCGSSTQTPQQLPPPSYPPTADGFKAQFSAALEAYQQQHPADGRGLLQQFRLPRSAGWFGDQIRPELDEVIPLEMDKVLAALKPAMANVGCEVKEATATCFECKRQHIYANSQHGGSGGESVTAGLEAKGAQTRVRISTGKGFYGRLTRYSRVTIPCRPAAVVRDF